MKHSEITGADNHSPITWVFADSSARTSGSDPNTSLPYKSSDIGKFAWQTDDDTIFMLTSTSPGWTDVNSTGSSPVKTVVSGNKITVDNSDPANPIINFAGTDCWRMAMGVWSWKV